MVFVTRSGIDSSRLWQRPASFRNPANAILSRKCVDQTLCKSSICGISALLVLACRASNIESLKILCIAVSFSASSIKSSIFDMKLVYNSSPHDTQYSNGLLLTAATFQDDKHTESVCTLLSPCCIRAVKDSSSIDKHQMGERRWFSNLNLWNLYYYIYLYTTIVPELGRQAFGVVGKVELIHPANLHKGAGRVDSAVTTLRIHGKMRGPTSQTPSPTFSEACRSASVMILNLNTNRNSGAETDSDHVMQRVSRRD